MPRIRLAHWHDGHAPGTNLDVSDDTLVALRRDGRVAAVLDPEPAEAIDTASAPKPEEATAAEAAPEPGPEAEDSGPSKGRRRR